MFYTNYGTHISETSLAIVIRPYAQNIAIPFTEKGWNYLSDNKSFAGNLFFILSLDLP